MDAPPSHPLRAADHAPGYVDLHVHTRCSDGALSPTEVVALASALGLRAIAVTDHDTMAGSAEALEAGGKAGVEVIPGVEISTHWEGVTFHLLGYGLRQDAPGLRATFDFLGESRRTRNPRMAARLRELGVDVTWEEIVAEAGDALVGRPHFARVLLRKGVVGTMQEAFDRFLGRSAPAYVNKERLSPAEACRIIAAAGGVAVLAHPGLIERDYPGRFPGLLHHLGGLCLGGIEAHYSRHTPEQTEFYLAVARQYDLIATGGSDFHRPEDGGPSLGTGFGSLRVPYSCAARLLERLHRTS